MISSVGFVPLGALKSEPTPLEITEADLKALKNRVQDVQDQSEASLEDSDADEEMIVEDDHKEIAVKTAKAKIKCTFLHLSDSSKQEVARKSSEFEVDSESNEMMRELKLDEYDSEEDIAGTSCLDNIVSSLPVEYSIKKDEEIEGESSEELSSDEDQVEIENTDVVILATKADEFLSSIEIWLYEEADDVTDGNLLVHHDIPLACYPLCCEYLDIQPGGGLQQCNMIAIGAMKTDIEIYDLDILDPISPITTLTLSDEKSKISTCALSSNEKYRNILAAGCDDKRLRIWDLAQGVITSEFKLHKSCVQSIGWNPSEHSILLSGGHDKKCCLIDVRSAESEALKWKLNAENEAIAWCPNHTTCFLASDETGEVVMFDARKGSNSDSIFHLEAHKENTTVLSFSPLNPSLFMTGSEDGKVKIWDMNDQTNPMLIEKQNLSVGEILAGGFCKYAGHLCIAAGEQGNLKVWDTRASKSVRTHYTSETYIPKIFRPTN